MKYIKTFEGRFDTIPEISINEIYQILENIFIEISDSHSPHSYSVLVRKSFDMDEDWELIKQQLLGYNITTEQLKTLCDNNPDFKYGLAAWCGHADLLLSKIYNRNTFLLGGDSREDCDTNPEKLYPLRYNYGWTSNKYGILVLERDYGSMENFNKIAKPYLDAV